jgi:hypothetical protein
MPESYSSRSAIAKRVLKSLGSSSSDRGAAAASLRGPQYNVYQAATAAATSAVVSFDTGTEQRFTVTEVKFLPTAALTANNTNYVRVSLEYNDGAGGAFTQCALALSTVAGTGNWVANRPVNIPLTADVSVPTGRTLHVRFLKVGTGVATSIGHFVIRGTWEDA